MGRASGVVLYEPPVACSASGRTAKEGMLLRWHKNMKRSHRDFAAHPEMPLQLAISARRINWDPKARTWSPSPRDFRRLDNFILITTIRRMQ